MPYTGRKMTGRKKMQERMSAKKKDAKKTAASKPKARVLKPGDKVATKKKATVTGKGGKTAGGKANVTKEQLKASGLTLRGYMNQWNKTGKRPTKKTTTAKKTTAKKKMSDRQAIEKTYGAGKTTAVFGATPAKISTKAKTKQANRGKAYAGMNSEEKQAKKRASEGKKYEKKAKSPTKSTKTTAKAPAKKKLTGKEARLALIKRGPTKPKAKPKSKKKLHTTGLRVM